MAPRVSRSDQQLQVPERLFQTNHDYVFGVGAVLVLVQAEAASKLKAEEEDKGISGWKPFRACSRVGPRDEGYAAWRTHLSSSLCDSGSGSWD